MSLSVIEPTDREAWDAFVSGEPRGSIYQSYEWGQLRLSQGWSPYYLAVLDGKEWIGSALVLVSPLPGRLGSVMYSPRGPVIRDDSNGLVVLTSAVKALAQKVGGIFWRVEPPVFMDEEDRRTKFKEVGFVDVPLEWSYWNRPKYDMHLDISGGEAAVWEGISSRTRGKIRHATKRGLTVQIGNHEQDLKSFYRLLETTSAKKRIPIRNLQYFSSLFETLQQADMGRLFLARKNHEVIAAGISSRFGQAASLLYLSNDYSMKYAGWTVQWEMIKWAIDEGCRLYDLAGSATLFPPRESDKGYGVYQFKRSFGAELVAWYGYADYVFRPTAYHALRAIERGAPNLEWLFVETPQRLNYWVKQKLFSHLGRLKRDDAETC